MVMLNKHNQEM